MTGGGPSLGPGQEPGRALDREIVRLHWLTPAELEGRKSRKQEVEALQARLKKLEKRVRELEKELKAKP